jgi:hypothetical protein
MKLYQTDDSKKPIYLPSIYIKDVSQIPPPPPDPSAFKTPGVSGNGAVASYHDAYNLDGDFIITIAFNQFYPQKNFGKKLLAHSSDIEEYWTLGITSGGLFYFSYTESGGNTVYFKSSQELSSEASGVGIKSEGGSLSLYQRVNGSYELLDTHLNNSAPKPSAGNSSLIIGGGKNLDGSCSSFQCFSVAIRGDSSVTAQKEVYVDFLRESPGTISFTTSIGGVNVNIFQNGAEPAEIISVPRRSFDKKGDNETNDSGLEFEISYLYTPGISGNNAIFEAGPIIPSSDQFAIYIDGEYDFRKQISDTASLLLYGSQDGSSYSVKLSLTAQTTPSPLFLTMRQVET